MQAQNHQIFETRHLRLIPYSLSLIKATLEGTEQLGRTLGVMVPPSWPGRDFAEALPVLAREMEEAGSEFAWNWLIVHKGENALIGDVGFMGGPREGRAEIGYSIVPEYRNQGYATEAALYLVHWALRQREIRLVTAQCLDDNLGSIKVLEKIGMRQLGTDGSLLQWETGSSR